MSAPATWRDNGAHGPQAVVVGGSVADLLAARVLSEHFRRITLVERDRFPDGREPRKGVSQVRHGHVLLPKGDAILSPLFPDLTAAPCEGAATILDIGADVRWYHLGSYKIRFESGIKGPAMGRPFLQWQIRRRTLALPNVQAMQECDVTGLLRQGRGSRSAPREPDGRRPWTVLLRCCTGC